MAESIKVYIFAATGLSREEFVRAYPDPVFVLSPFSSAEKSGSITRVEHGGGRVSVVPFEVVRVKKRGGANKFLNMITIGRGSSNDVEVKAGEVSKFHAFCTISGGSVSITDAGSTNGTAVNGSPVPHKTSHKLTPGDEVSLGGLLVTFHDPASFYSFLRTAIGQES